MTHQLDQDVSRVSHPQPEPSFKGTQTMEDVVTKEDTDAPPPPQGVDLLHGESRAAAPSLDCYQECTFSMNRTCAAPQTFQSSVWQLFNIFKGVVSFRGPAFTSTKAVCPSIHPGDTRKCAQTHWRCDWCEEINKHLEHELACSTAAHQHDRHCMQGRIEMLHLELSKVSDEMFSQEKLFREETDLQKSRFDAQIQVAHREIDQLGVVNEKLRGFLTLSSSRNKKLARQIESLEQEKAKASSASGSYLESLATPQLLETSVHGVKDALGSFSKELMSIMKSRNWDVTPWARNLLPAVRFSRPSHVKFALQSYICRQLFRGFEREDFDIITGQVQFLSFDRRQAEFFSQYKMLNSLQASELMMDLAPETPALKDFIHYCHKNYVDIVPGGLENFLGNDSDLGRCNLKQGKGPLECVLVYQAFFRLSKLVWALHRLAFSFEPQAHVIRVERGAKFDGVYMRSIVMDDEYDEVAGLDVETNSPAVGFMVLPGFRVSKCVVKSQVYLNLMDSNQVVDQE